MTRGAAMGAMVAALPMVPADRASGSRHHTRNKRLHLVRKLLEGERLARVEAGAPHARGPRRILKQRNASFGELLVGAPDPHALAVAQDRFVAARGVFAHDARPAVPARL